MITIKSKLEIEYMREAGRVVGEVLEILKGLVQPGITTAELDKKAEEHIRKRGARPSFLGYGGFPATICASVNEEVVHGIPGKRELREGDIISIDVGAQLKGYHGDAAITLPVGKISTEIELLLKVTEKSLYLGIEKAIVGNRLGDISHSIQNYCESFDFTVVKEYVGHGIGSQMHEDPQIPNYGPPNRGIRLKSGMALAIEPMINLGREDVVTLNDGWTVITTDGLPSAHFEHTIAITEDGPTILTRP